MSINNILMFTAIDAHGFNTVFGSQHVRAFQLFVTTALKVPRTASHIKALVGDMFFSTGFNKVNFLMAAARGHHVQNSKAV